MTKTPMAAVVSAAEAQIEPYPYVYVNEDGSVRELHASERNYLETEFLSADGGRPYVKTDYQSKAGRGSIAGFCLRFQIPNHIPIAIAPTNDPNPPMSRVDFIAMLKSKGFDVTENPDGTTTARRANK